MNEHLRALRLRRRLEEAGPVLWQMAAGFGGFSLAAGGVFLLKRATTAVPPSS